MAQTKNNKVKIRKVEVNIADVLSWMEKQGRYVTSVELRDRFNWPLRETARQLMRFLEKEDKVVILPHPARKKAYCYGLPDMKKPTVKDFPKPKRVPTHFKSE